MPDPDFTIDRVRMAEIAVDPAPVPFEQDNAGAIAARWGAARAANPALFNGIVHLCSDARRHGDVFHATVHPVRFATLMFWRQHPDKGGLRNTFGDVILRGSDGPVLLGRMAPNTANAGRWCLPGGSFDDRDVVDGRIDPTACILRECAEETGLERDSFDLAPQLLVYRDALRVAHARVATLLDTAQAARRRIRAFLAADPDPELVEITMVTSAAEARALIPDTYECHLIEHLFREDPA